MMLLPDMFQMHFGKCLTRYLQHFDKVFALVPGLVLIPLRIAKKLNMTKSESILNN